MLKTRISDLKTYIRFKEDDIKKYKEELLEIEKCMACEEENRKLQDQLMKLNVQQVVNMVSTYNDASADKSDRIEYVKQLRKHVQF